MTVGYIRVSTQDQHTERQEELMRELGIKNIFIEKVSGKSMARPKLQAMLEVVTEGDTVIIESYSRLARSTKDLLHIVETLKAKGVTLISHKEQIDTSTAAGNLLLTILAGLSQFERECMLERQSEGIAIAKAEGKYKGRKPISFDSNQWEKLYPRWKSGEITAVYMMKQLDLQPRTFYRRVKEYESSKA